MKLGNAIKSVRVMKGLRQGDIADKIKITGAYLSQIENNSKMPSGRILRNLARELDVSVSFFLITSVATNEEERNSLISVQPLIDKIIDQLT